MKLILFVLIISTLDIFITIITCEDRSLLTDPIITKSYPKKYRKLQILNPRKFLNIKSKENRKVLKKHVMKHEGYTYFPPISNPHVAPESPFFQPDYDIEPKVRVKKVLPGYLFRISRGKRSVKDNKDEDNNVKRKRQLRNKKTGRNIRNHGAKTKKSKTNSTHKSKKLKNNNKRVVRSKHQLRNDGKSKVNKNHNRHKPKLTQKRKEIEPKDRRTHKGHEKDKNLRTKKVRRQAKTDSRRLIAGKDAMIADYPYVVSIQKGGEHWCAGALLNQRLVITTANCVWKSDHLSRLRIRAGSRYIDRGGQVAKIQEVLKHPKWSIRSGPDNDVALILLDRNIKFSDKVHSVDLPNRIMMPAFDDAWVTSWGAERRDGIFENTQLTLQAYHSRLMQRERCNNVTVRYGVRVSDNFICLTQAGRRAPCTRDTGAPAVSDGILWGLASWGIRKLCGAERFPAMFSYLASPSNLDFITNATLYLMSEQRHYPFPDRFEAKYQGLPTTARANEYL